MPTPNLRPRGRIWYLRREIPLELRRFYPKNKTGDLWRSLRTTDRAEAQRRFHPKMVKLDAEFEGHRKTLAQEAADANFANDPRFDNVREAINDVGLPYFADGLSNRDVAPTRIEPYKPTPLGKSATKQIIDEIISEIDYDIDHPLKPTTISEVDGEVIEEDFIIPDHLAGPARKLLREWLASQKKSMLARKAQLEADAEPGKEAAPEPSDCENKTLHGLLAVWRTERKPKPKTVLEMKKAVARFEQVNGPLPYTDITTTHARQFKEHILGLEAKSATKSPFRKLTLAG